MVIAVSPLFFHDPPSGAEMKTHGAMSPVATPVRPAFDDLHGVRPLGDFFMVMGGLLVEQGAQQLFGSNHRRADLADDDPGGDRGDGLQIGAQQLMAVGDQAGFFRVGATGLHRQTGFGPGFLRRRCGDAPAGFVVADHRRKHGFDADRRDVAHDVAGIRRRLHFPLSVRQTPSPVAAGRPPTFFLIRRARLRPSRRFYTSDP
jgi:hypothetical protein